MSGKRVRASGGHSLVWLQGLACGALVALAPAAAVMLFMLLAPGLLALYLDRHPGRPVARAVLTCGLAGSVEPLRMLWNAGSSVSASLAIAGGINAIGTAWSAAAAGWLLGELAPVVVRAGLEASSLSRAARLRATRKRLTEEWGLDEPQSS